MYYLVLLLVALCTCQTIRCDFEYQYINLPPTSAPTIAPTPSYDIVTKTCETTLYPDLCMAVFESFPGSGQLSDLDSMAQHALKLAAQKAEAVHLRIKELLNQTSDGFIEQCLADCKENYKEATDRIEDALAALSYGSYTELSSWVMAAMMDAESCEEGFNEKPGKNSPLSDMNTVFARLCSVCVSITDLLLETGGTYTEVQAEESSFAMA